MVSPTLAFVAQTPDNSVAVIDVDPNGEYPVGTQLATVNVGSAPLAVAVRGSEVYVLDNNDAVSAYNAAGLTP